MHDLTRYYLEEEGRLERLGTAAAVSLGVEILRYRIHPDQFVGDWWTVVLGCVTINWLYHAWSLPETHPKAIVSASFSEMSMPSLYHTLMHLASSTAASAWLFLQQNVSGLQMRL